MLLEDRLRLMDSSSQQTDRDVGCSSSFPRQRQTSSLLPHSSPHSTSWQSLHSNSNGVGDKFSHYTSSSNSSSWWNQCQGQECTRTTHTRHRHTKSLSLSAVLLSTVLLTLLVFCLFSQVTHAAPHSGSLPSRNRERNSFIGDPGNCGIGKIWINGVGCKLKWGSDGHRHRHNHGNSTGRRRR